MRDPSLNLRAALAGLLALALLSLAIEAARAAPPEFLEFSTGEGRSACAALGGRTFGESSVSSQLIWNSFCLASGSGPRGILFQVLLPLRWNRRMLSIGGSGWDGTLHDHFPASLSAWTGGYAWVRSNGGHGDVTGAVFLHSGEAKIDFAYLSVHSAFETAKEITSAFYGEPAGKH